MYSKKPKVSVIVPIYNVEKFLSQCLDCLINQTLKDIEIICVNDGSTDNSLQILEEYSQKDERIKIINQANGGLSSARNSGIKIAQGEFIGFLDSDDYLDLNFYESLYSRAKDTNSDIVTCEYIYKITNNDKKKELFLKVNRNVVTSDVKEKFECLYLPFYCYVQNKIYKKDCIKDNFIEGLTFEDIYFTTTILAENNKMAVAKDVAYYYRNQPNSISNDVSNYNKHFYHKAMAFFFKFVHDKNIDINTEKYYKTRKFRCLGITFFKIKKACFRTKYSILEVLNFTINR